MKGEDSIRILGKHLHLPRSTFRTSNGPQPQANSPGFPPFIRGITNPTYGTRLTMVHEPRLPIQVILVEIINIAKAPILSRFPNKPPTRFPRLPPFPPLLPAWQPTRAALASEKPPKPQPREVPASVRPGGNVEELSWWWFWGVGLFTLSPIIMEVENGYIF